LPASAPEESPRPFVETTIARHLLNRLRMTHEEKAISVFSGPWGIGKTTALDAFHEAHEGSCVIVKVEPGMRGKGAAPARVIQFVAESLQHQAGKPRAIVSTGYLALRQLIYTHMLDMFGPECVELRPDFTFIFDEAQYLSREAIEMLRYWNDGDRCTTPFPVGLVFVGNNEFSLQEDMSGHSAISGAVRSRALFIEPLDYTDVTDTDLVLFAQSRGIGDAAAIAAIVAHYSAPRAKRDLRNVERLLATLQRRAAGQPVTRQIVQSFLNPA